VGGMVEANSLYENILFFVKMIPMLLGEELVTIIPFLIILQFSYKNSKISRKKAIVMSWIISSLLFAAIHLPTYNWNIIQAIVGIGIVRMIITYPYIKTKNIWISFFVHVLNDWILLLPILLAK
uniref:CPBP family intramembrane glutamic endopeptidase n=1 Tax=Faecalimicrobium dakarense TaxID=1301100 RepID=UPI0005A9D1DA